MLLREVDMMFDWTSVSGSNV